MGKVDEEAPGWGRPRNPSWKKLLNQGAIPSVSLYQQTTFPKKDPEEATQPSLCSTLR